MYMMVEGYPMSRRADSSASVREAFSAVSTPCACRENGSRQFSPTEENGSSQGHNLYRNKCAVLCRPFLLSAPRAKREHVNDFHLQLRPDYGFDCLVYAIDCLMCA